MGHERFAGPVDPIENGRERRLLEFRKRVGVGPADQIAAANDLLVERIGQTEDVVRPGHHRGRDRRLLEQVVALVLHHRANVQRLDPGLRLTDPLGELQQVIAIRRVEGQARTDPEHDVAACGSLRTGGNRRHEDVTHRLGPRAPGALDRCGQRPTRRIQRALDQVIADRLGDTGGRRDIQADRPHRHRGGQGWIAGIDQRERHVRALASDDLR